MYPVSCISPVCIVLRKCTSHLSWYFTANILFHFFSCTSPRFIFPKNVCKCFLFVQTVPTAPIKLSIRYWYIFGLVYQLSAYSMFLAHIFTHKFSYYSTSKIKRIISQLASKWTPISQSQITISFSPNHALLNGMYCRNRTVPLNKTRDSLSMSFWHGLNILLNYSRTTSNVGYI